MSEDAIKPKRRMVGCGCKRRQQWLVKQAKSLSERIGFLESAMDKVVKRMYEEEKEEDKVSVVTNESLNNAKTKPPKRFIRK